MSLDDKYFTFHGKEPKTRSSYDFHVPKGLILLGKAVAIEYKTNKKHGGGDGKTAVYRHSFDTPCNVYMDEKCKRQLYIIGPKLKVTEAGIEN